MNSQAKPTKNWYRLGRDNRDLLVAAQFASEDDFLDLPDAWESRTAPQGHGFLALPPILRRACILCAALPLGYLLGIWVALYPNSVTSIPAGETTPVTSQEKPAPHALEHSRRVAHRVAKRFLETSDIAEKIELVRNPETVAPLVTAFYQNAPDLLKEPAVHLQPLTSVFVDGMRFHRFHAKYLESDRLVVVQAHRDDYKVDWETFARHNPVPWSTFVQPNGPHRATFRVRITSTDYFNFKFNDNLRLLAYKIEIPDVSDPIYGYVSKGSSTARRLNRYLRNASENRVMLELSRPERIDGSTDTQVEILRFVQPGWVSMERTPQEAVDRAFGS